MAKALKEMGSTDVKEWLTGEGFSQEVVQALYGEEINGESLLELVDDKNTTELSMVCKRMNDRLKLKRLVRDKAQVHDALVASRQTDTGPPVVEEYGEEFTISPLAEECKQEFTVPPTPHCSLDVKPESSKDSTIKTGTDNMKEKPMEIITLNDDEPLPNPFKLPKFRSDLIQDLQSGRLNVKTMREVAKATVNAIIIYTSHPLPTERNRIARQLVTAYPCLADRDADIPESAMSQAIRSQLKEHNRSRTKKRPPSEMTKGSVGEDKKIIPKKEKFSKKPGKTAVSMPNYGIGEDETSHERHCTRLQKEFKTEKPDILCVKNGMRLTFPFRRRMICEDMADARKVVQTYPFLQHIQEFKEEIQRVVGCPLFATAVAIEKVIEQASLEDRLDMKEELDKAKDLLANRRSLLGLKLLCHLMHSKQGKVDTADVCRQIPESIPIEEAALCETTPTILYTAEQNWLVVDGLPILQPPTDQIPEMLVGAYYVFNVKYKPRTKPVLTFLEKISFNKYITQPGQLVVRLNQIINSK